MKTCLPDRRNPRLAKAEGSDGRTRRDCPSGVETNDTTIIFESSTPVAHISGLFLAGVLRVPDRNSRDDALYALPYTRCDTLIETYLGAAPVSAQPGGYLRQPKSRVQTSEPKFAGNTASPRLGHSTSDRTLDKIDESVAVASHLKAIRT